MQNSGYKNSRDKPDRPKGSSPDSVPVDKPGGKGGAFMKSLLLSITVISLLAFSANSFAECGSMNNGYDLLSCIESNDPQLYGYGLGFISGVTIAYRAMSQGILKPDRICIPKGVKIREVRGVVQDYLLSNPDELNQRAWFLVSEAVKDAYRCY